MRKQIALCIGNDNYKYLGELNCAVNDARSVASKLSTLNYDVKCGENLTAKEMHEAIGEFQENLPNYDVALFYFAGHGFEIEGENLLMPIDAEVDARPESKKFFALNMNTVIDALEGKRIPNQVKFKIIIIDACRQGDSLRGYGNRGFAATFAPVGTLIAFSTSPGQVAKEINGHGLYTEALVKYLDMPRIPIENMFKQVRELLAANTRGMQISWEHTSLMGNYYFNEDRIDAFAVYTDEAYRDSEYIFADRNHVGIVVEGLKSHNWGIQNAAINEIKNINWEEVRANDIFVLGRNIYQAAVGGAWDAKKFIRDFTTVGFIPFNAKIHLLNGMSFEIYYNSKGQLRDHYKSEYYLEILAIIQKEEFQICKNFINEILSNEDKVLLYLPYSEERMEFRVNCKESERLENDIIFTIDSIYYHGKNVFYTGETGKEYFWIKAIRLSDFKIELAKQLLAPIDLVKLDFNIENSDNYRIALPVQFCLMNN